MRTTLNNQKAAAILKRKKIALSLKFDLPGTFESMYAAQAWCKENGYSYGSHCAGMPTALVEGDCDISKWYNLSLKDIKAIDGVMSCQREGSATITIYEHE